MKSDLTLQLRSRYILSAALAMVIALGIPQNRTSAIDTYQTGDVFISVGDGAVEWWKNLGNNTYSYRSTLEGAPSLFTNGSGTDKDRNLYVSALDTGTINKFDATGAFVGIFAAGDPGSHLGSLLVSRANQTTTSFALYAGQPDGTGDILKFDGTGALVDRFNVPSEVRGSSWIDLGADLCTMYYTSEGPHILLYDVCKKQALGVFNASEPGVRHNGVRVLPRGQVLAAHQIDIRRYGPGGNVIQTYSIPGFACWSAITVDPDGTSFWSADFCNSEVVKFDLASGAVLATIAPQKLAPVVFGLSVLGEKTASGRNGSIGILTACEAKFGATQGGWGTTLTGSMATFGGNARVDKDGFVSGHETYDDHSVLLPMSLHSTIVFEVTCGTNTCTNGVGDPHGATIRGQGKVRETDLIRSFQIDLEDNGEPGLMDKYQMRFVEHPTEFTEVIVYDSGCMTLQGGNVQIRQ